MKILVTGGAGFIGSHACDLLLSQGHSVVALDNFDESYSSRAKRRNIASALQLPNYRLVEGNFGDRLAVSKLLQAEEFDSVLHLGGSCGTCQSLDHALRYQKNNTGNLIGLLQAMREHGPMKIVTLSPAAVYGSNTPLPFREDAKCLTPLSPYAATKRAGEIFLGTYAQLYKVKAIILRGFNVYGPRQRPQMVVSRFIRKILQGQAVTVDGDGSATRDFIFVADVCAAISAALTKFPADFDVYNVGTGKATSVNTLLKTIETVLNKSTGVQYLPANPCEMPHQCADISKAKQDLGFVSSMALKDGIERSVEWMRQTLASDAIIQTQGAAAK